MATAPASEALAMRTWLRGSWDGELLPAIERAFDRAAPGDEVVRIPRLEIRLTVPAGADLHALLPELLEQRMADELSALLAAGASTDGAPAVERRPLGDDRIATLRHYLRTGTLPWSVASVRPAPEIAAELRAAARGELHRATLLSSPALRDPSTRDALFRLLQLLGDEAAPSLAAIAPGLSARWSAAITRLLQPHGASASEAAVGTLPPALHVRLAAASALLVAARSRAVPDDVDAIFAVAREALGAADFAAIESLLVPSAPSEPTEARRLSPVSASPVDVRTDDRAASSSVRGGASDGDVASALPTAHTFSPAATSAVAASSRAEGRLDDHPLAVASAGLILLHPYIERLFAATGVAAGRTLPDASRPRAAALLHWLATGREEIHELELGLVKLLIGLEPDESLPVADGLLHPADLEECTALLDAVVEHWSILKRTSVAGLRTSFLQRAALLRRVEHGWSLHPEPAPYDVLLDHLPWSFSVVRLPWMPEPIHTEWTTR